MDARVFLVVCTVAAALAQSTYTPVTLTKVLHGGPIPPTGGCAYPSLDKHGNPDPRMVITDQNGVAHIWHPDHGYIGQIANFGARGVNAMNKTGPNPFNPQDHSGLIGCAFAPHNASIIYFHYTAYPEANSVGIVGNQTVSAFIVDVTSQQVIPTSEVKLVWAELLTKDRVGGCLKFDKQGSLLVGFGCGSTPTTTDPVWTGKPQDPTVNQGKILRIRPNPDAGSSPAYTIPLDNPNPNSPVFAVGAIQPFSCGVDAQNGKAFFADVSTTTTTHYQEINRLYKFDNGAQANYGAEVVTGPEVCVVANCTVPSVNYVTPMVYYNEADPSSTGIWGTAIVITDPYRGTALDHSLRGLIIAGDVGVSYQGLGKPIYPKLFLASTDDDDDETEVPGISLLSVTNLATFTNPAPSTGNTWAARFLTNILTMGNGEPLLEAYFFSGTFINGNAVPNTFQEELWTVS